MGVTFETGDCELRRPALRGTGQQPVFRKFKFKSNAATEEAGLRVIRELPRPLASEDLHGENGSFFRMAYPE